MTWLSDLPAWVWFAAGVTAAEVVTFFAFGLGRMGRD